MSDFRSQAMEELASNYSERLDRLAMDSMTQQSFTYPVDHAQAMATAQQHIHDLQSQIYEQATPFEETADFRDFVVWLCGFTGRSSPPSQEDWDGLCDRTKQVAAKFALKARKDAHEKLRRVSDLYETSGYSSASGTTTSLPITGFTISK